MSNEFTFTKQNLSKAKKYISNYPSDRKSSAVLSLLDLAQRQNHGWLSRACLEYVADMLSIPYVKLYEIASFYTMFNLEPVGKYTIHICGTTPCWLRGSNEILALCKQKLNIGYNETTQDNMFTLKETECLGACTKAPALRINDKYYENLSEEKLAKILDDLLIVNKEKK